MRKLAVSGLAVAATLCAAALVAAPVFAQDIAPAAPSDTQAVAAGDVASIAVAQVNDQADNAAKFVDQTGNASQVETYMVEAVVKIMKTFKESVAS